MNEIVRAEMTRREALRRLGVGGAVLTLPALLAACGSGGSSSTSGAGGTRASGSVAGAGTDAEIDHVTWSLGGTPPTLDIATGNLTVGEMVMALGMETLMGLDDRLRLTPVLAESSEEPDPRTYVYRLREGVRFWDGSPLTVDDVVWSLRRHMDPKVSSQISTYFSHVRSIEATGPREVTVRMTQPDPLFPYAHVHIFIMPKAFGERLGKKLGAPAANVTVMGTGPYRITSFTGDNEILVERNDDYWGERQRVRRASLKFIGDPRTNLLAMRSGEIDGMFEFAISTAREWDRLPDARTEWSPGMSLVLLSFDLTQEPWDDLHVRRAVAHAADRAGYVRAFLGGHGEPATTIPAPLQWGDVATPDEVRAIYARLPAYAFDLEAAKAELAKSAHPDGFTADVVFPNSAAPAGRALVSLSETLEQLGITLNVREVPQNTWLAKLYAHKDLGLQYIRLSPDYVDPSNFPGALLPSANAVPNNFNLANFRDAEVDRLLAKQGKTTDAAVRTEALTRVLEIAGEQLPYLPLWWESVPMGLADRFVYEGFNPLYYAENWLGKLRVRA